MPTFQFYLADFKITDTRSHHNDTLIAGFGVAVNGTVVGVQVAQMGDFNNGTFEFWQHKLNALNGVVINPTDRVSFTFQMYNNGDSHHPNEEELDTAITTDLTTMQAKMQDAIRRHDVDDDISDTPDTLGEGTLTDEQAAALFTGGLYELFKAIFKNCDGIVVGGAFSFVGQSLENSINAAPGNVLKTTNTFNANANNYGKPCNSSGSNYIVTWIIQHQP